MYQQNIFQDIQIFVIIFSGTTCRYDYLKITEVKTGQTEKVCGSELPGPYTIGPSGEARLQFVSDNSRTGKGKAMKSSCLLS